MVVVAMHQPINDLMYRFGPASVREAASRLGLDLSDQWEPQIRRELIRCGARPAMIDERARAWVKRNGFTWVKGMSAMVAGEEGVVVHVDGLILKLVFDDGRIVSTVASDWLPNLTHAPTAALCERTYLIAWAFRVHDEGTPRTIHVADVLVWLGVTEGL